MSLWRNPLLPAGFLLIVLGFGNWYTGRDKAREYEKLLAAGDLPTSVEDVEEFRELTPRTNATLLRTFQHGTDESTLAHAKLDFYQVVQSGGRILVLSGLFCAAAGLTHTWYRRRLAVRPITAARSA